MLQRNNPRPTSVPSYSGTGSFFSPGLGKYALNPLYTLSARVKKTGSKFSFTFSMQQTSTNPVRTAENTNENTSALVMSSINIYQIIIFIYQ